MLKVIKKLKIQDKYLEIETGSIARRANGSALVKYGNTTVLAVAVADYSRETDGDFVPLTIDFVEKYYASGKIPGGYLKREGRPSLKATSSARFIDRSLRPNFPKYYRHDTQVTVTVLSYDNENSDITWLGVIASSAALAVSDIPFDGPIASCYIGYDSKNYISIPDKSKETSLELTVTMKDKLVYAIECECNELQDKIIIGAIESSKKLSEDIINIQKELAKEVNKRKMNNIAKKGSINNEVELLLKKEINSILKSEKRNKLEELESFFDRFVGNFQLSYDQNVVLKICYEEIVRDLCRKHIITTTKRLDGRNLDTIREIYIELSPLPVVHGSALFGRGFTQALGVTTLGPVEKQQFIDDLDEENRKRFFLHYNFPKYSVGEISNVKFPVRRELGHGALAEKALMKLIPSEEDFPYTIRVVADILESNGSTSMASVCAGSLSLMLSGVPIKRNVSGISIGLIRESGKYALLTDAKGFEDNIGDMDLKVAETEKGITAVHMDIRCDRGIEIKILGEAFGEARIANLNILKMMNKHISSPVKELPKTIPKYGFVKIASESIGLLIGRRGETIDSITNATSTKISIDNDGTIKIAYFNINELEKAKQLIEKAIKIEDDRYTEKDKKFSGKPKSDKKHTEKSIVDNSKDKPIVDKPIINKRDRYKKPVKESLDIKVNKKVKDINESFKDISLAEGISVNKSKFSNKRRTNTKKKDN